jgi:hypothetical protein
MDTHLHMDMSYTQHQRVKLTVSLTIRLTTTSVTSDVTFRQNFKKTPSHKTYP